MRRSSKKKRDLHSFRDQKRPLSSTKAKTRRAQNDDDEGGEKKN